jgi:hypothetical protein
LLPQTARRSFEEKFHEKNDEVIGLQNEVAAAGCASSVDLVAIICRHKHHHLKHHYFRIIIIKNNIISSTIVISAISASTPY